MERIEDIFIFTFHMEVGIMLHYLEKQCSKEIRTAQRTARVAALNCMHHSYNIPAYLAGDLLEVVHIFYCVGKAKIY